MSILHTNQQTTTSKVSSPAKTDPSFTKRDNLNEYLTFNILGKIYHIKQSLFQNNPDLFRGTLFTEFDQLEQFYDRNRRQYVIDISPLMFENILQYYTTQKLFEPSNVHIDYFKETLNKFHIDTSSLDIDERYERLVSRQPAFQLIHVLLEYADCE